MTMDTMEVSHTSVVRGVSKLNLEALPNLAFAQAPLRQ